MYTPKNRILTNQYSRGYKLVYVSSGEYYTGFYHKTFDGKYFTGKTPNDPPIVELELAKDTSTNYTASLPQNEIAYTDAPTIFSDLETPGYDEGMIVDYARVNDINLLKQEKTIIPYSHYPKPTKNDYKLGVFTRYFVVKTNENRYIEVSEEMYKNITNESPQYLWQPYTAFKLQWTLAGDESYVATTNRNSILLAEKEIKRKGLIEFLRGNYLKFYITEEMDFLVNLKPMDLSISRSPQQPQRNQSQSSPITGSSFTTNFYG